MDKVKIHADICKTLTSLYKAKNADYGDSFAKSFKEYGMIMPCIRLEDKLNRIKSLALGKDGPKVPTESLADTLMDLANYAIMTIIECENYRPENNTIKEACSAEVMAKRDEKCSTATIRCPQCYANIADDKEYCHNCGVEIPHTNKMED